MLIKGFGSFNNLRGWFNPTTTWWSRRQSRVETVSQDGRFLGPADIDNAQIYDCFTYAVLTQLEDYGFWKRARGGDFAARAHCAWVGDCRPTRQAGSSRKAHVEGMLQVVEGVCQMRPHPHPAERQVKDAEIALVSGHGGNQVCHST